MNGGVTEWCYPFHLAFTQRQTQTHTHKHTHTESLTTTLWEPEKTDDIEKNRRADMRDAGYRETN